MADHSVIEWTMNLLPRYQRPRNMISISNSSDSFNQQEKANAEFRERVSFLERKMDCTIYSTRERYAFKTLPTLSSVYRNQKEYKQWAITLAFKHMTMFIKVSNSHNFVMLCTMLCTLYIYHWHNLHETYASARNLVWVWGALASLYFIVKFKCNTTCQSNIVFFITFLLQIVFNMSRMFYLNCSWQ